MTARAMDEETDTLRANLNFHRMAEAGLGNYLETLPNQMVTPSAFTIQRLMFY